VSERASRAVAAVLALLAVAMEAGAVVLHLLNRTTPDLRPPDFNEVSIQILVVTFSGIGWLIASRRRDNRIGWMFLAAGFFYGLTAFSGSYATHGLVADPGSLPLADVLAWLSGLTWVPALTLLILLLLFFPDGRLPSRRWRPAVLVAGLASSAMLIPNAIADWPYRGPALLVGDSSVFAADTAVATAGVFQVLGLLLILGVAASGAAALAMRFRRSAGTEHQQIKWFATAAVIETAALLVMSGLDVPSPFDAIAAIIVTPFIPVAVGVAILRYRLYTIDRIISRTIGYAAVTGVLVATFAAVILLSQAVFAPLTGGNTLAVAASTLVVAALFQPLRLRVQRAMDRRFDRARYDGERTAAAFAERLRGQVDLAGLETDLTRTVDTALRPSATAVWLRTASGGR
jgi:hypothetical protein